MQNIKNKTRSIQLDVAAAIRLYYSNIELSNSDISQMFGGISAATIAKLKDQARKIMAKKGIPVFDSKCVNTICAFEAWNLNIDDLEKRYKKLKQLFPEKYSVDV